MNGKTQCYWMKQIRAGREASNATYRFNTHGLELRAIKIFSGASYLLKVHSSINSHFSGVNLRRNMTRCTHTLNDNSHKPA